MKINKALQYPLSTIGLLRFKLKNPSSPYYGTGFWVGENMVLTTAHNCYD